MALSLILRRASTLQGTNIVMSHCKSLNQIGQPALRLLTSKVNNNNNIKTVSLLGNGLVKRNMSSTGDHSKLWPIEKALSLVLFGLTPVTFLTPNMVCDNLFALITVVHMHWGMEAVVVDYVRPILFGPVIPKLSVGLVYLVTAVTLGGLIYYNVNDIGIGKTFQKLWAVGRKKE